MRFQGQRIAILGGTSGLGLATAKAAAAEGADVVVASATAARVEGALVQLPASAEGHVVDLLDEDAVRAFFAAVGALDHLAFTAGESLQLGLVADTPVADARRATPEASLADLAERLELHRSTVQRALERMERLAVEADDAEDAKEAAPRQPALA